MSRVQWIFSVYMSHFSIVRLAWNLNRGGTKKKDQVIGTVLSGKPPKVSRTMEKHQWINPSQNVWYSIIWILFHTHKNVCTHLFLSNLLEPFQNDLPVPFQDLQLGLVFYPAIWNHRHKIEPDVMVGLSEEWEDKSDTLERKQSFSYYLNYNKYILYNLNSYIYIYIYIRAVNR